MKPSSAVEWSTSPVEILAEVTRRNGLDGLAVRLDGLWRWLATDLAALERSLEAVGSTEGDLGWRSARYLLDRPGKRIRPVCLALAARAGGRPFDDLVRDAAVVCELVHTATLLHDDVVDEGTQRRGVPPARLVYGNSASVLGGDHLLVEALRRVDRCCPRHRGELLDVVAGMVTAEVAQLERRRRFDADREAYRRIAVGKTAALFRWALRAGGRLGGLEDAHVDALGCFGDSLGIAFQLVDDALDLVGDPATTGKTACADLREGKATWPLLYAAERDPDIAARLRVLAAGDHEPDPRVAQDLVDAVVRTGALAATHAEAARHGEAAHAALGQLPTSRAREALATVVDAALSREA